MYCPFFDDEMSAVSNASAGARRGSDSSTRAPVTALVITKNEERSIADCIRSLAFCDQVIVIDSLSDDRTAQIAERLGAIVVPFDWNGRFPKKKQWAMDLPMVRNSWVLHIDADERVSGALASEIQSAISSTSCVAYDIKIQYHFAGRALRHGHRVVKRSLVRRDRCVFPDIGDDSLPGITEVEGHYQPRVDGELGRLEGFLTHDDPDPFTSWVGRHSRYAEWEAALMAQPSLAERVRANRSRQGRLFSRVPGKPLAFFLYSFVYRLGFLDGRAGFDYAVGLSFYYWMIGVNYRELGSR